MNFDFFSPGRIVFGRGRLSELPELVKARSRRPLLVAGRSFMKGAHAESLLEGFRKVGVEAVLLEGGEGETSVGAVDRGVGRAREALCDGVVGVGGGSVLDTAKAIAGLASNPGSVRDYLDEVGTGRVMERDPLPLAAVPTTAGTGSEVTGDAVITSYEDGFKKSFRDPRLIADIALVDPDLTASQPPSLTADSGMEAFGHLVEAFTSKLAEPIPDSLAMSGIGLCRDYLIPAVRNGGEMEAREGMALAATLGGLCRTNAELGGVQGISAALCATARIPHGRAAALLLPAVMAFNASRSPVRYAVLGRLLTGERRDSDGADAAAACGWVLKLMEEIGIPLSFKSFGVDNAMVNKVARHAFGSSMKRNPVEITAEDCEKILLALIQ